MIIIFSKPWAASPSHKTHDTVVETVDSIGRQKFPLKGRGGNLVAGITWCTGRRVRFVLNTRDAWALGSRTAASGRHMRKASWEAHRDVMVALFDVDPNAVIKTALATYRGRKHFYDTFERTAGANFGGSLMNPCSIRSCSIWREGA